MNTDSRSLASAAERVDLLCHNLFCPVQPTDAAYALTVSTGGLLNREVSVTLRGALSIQKSDVAKWTLGCRSAPLPRKPEWAAPFLVERGLTPTAAPDTYLCDGQRRWVHVADGVLLWEVGP